MNNMDQDCLNGYVQCGEDGDDQATEEARREDLIGGCIDSQSRVSKLVGLGDRKFNLFCMISISACVTKRIEEEEEEEEDGRRRTKTDEDGAGEGEGNTGWKKKIKKTNLRKMTSLETGTLHSHLDGPLA